jgi:hypothetical protein
LSNTRTLAFKNKDNICGKDKDKCMHVLSWLSSGLHDLLKNNAITRRDKVHAFFSVAVQAEIGVGQVHSFGVITGCTGNRLLILCHDYLLSSLKEESTSVLSRKLSQQGIGFRTSKAPSLLGSLWITCTYGIFFSIWSYSRE